VNEQAKRAYLNPDELLFCHFYGAFHGFSFLFFKYLQRSPDEGYGLA